MPARFEWSDEAVSAFMDAAVVPTTDPTKPPQLNVPAGMSAAMLEDGPRAFIMQLERYLGMIAKTLDERNEAFNVVDTTTGYELKHELSGYDLLVHVFGMEPTNVV